MIGPVLPMDVLSEILKVVRLDAALFYNGEFSAPWAFRSPHSSMVAPYLGPDRRHVIIYHLLTYGRAFARLEEGPSLTLEAGDVVVFPHGDAHIMGNGTAPEIRDHGKELERILEQGVKLARMGGGGETSRFVCGYMACDPHLSTVLLRGLPALLKVNIRSGSAGSWLENAIRFGVAEAGDAGAGGGAVLAKLSEALFVETLRRYLQQLPEGNTGWLAGARDPQVGQAMALLHAKPEHPWTVAGLAHAAGVSRSVLAERFHLLLGETPITYLARWRLRLGAQRLSASSDSVAQVAAAVGYRSEAAFNRAFRREFGLPPARFRNSRRKAAGTS